MAQLNSFPGARSLEPEVIDIDGYVATDHNGVVLNVATPATALLRADGSRLVFPKGILSITKDATNAGQYNVVLDSAWSSIIFCQAALVSTAALGGNMHMKLGNVTGSVDSWGRAAKTIQLQYVNAAGSGAVLPDAGFHILLKLKNTKLGTVGL